MTSTSAAPASPPSAGPSATPPANPSPNPRPRGRFFRPLQWLPPLLVLLPLASRDSTFAQMTLLPFAVAAIISFVSILVRVVFLLFRRGDPARLLRPTLTLVLFCAVFAYVDHSKHEARIVAGELAAQMQAACERDGRCPAQLPLPADVRYGTLRWLPTPTTHLQWALRYVPTDEGFEMQLLEMMDISARWRGGPKVPLVADRVEDGFEIPLGPDGQPLRDRADFD